MKKVFALFLMIWVMMLTACGSAAKKTAAESEIEACVPKAEFYADAGVPDGTAVKAGIPFIRIWKIRNVGYCAWDETYSVVQKSGDGLSSQPVALDAAPPGEVISVAVAVTIDSTVPPEHEVMGHFQLLDPHGKAFGPVLSLLVVVTGD